MPTYRDFLDFKLIDNAITANATEVASRWFMAGTVTGWPQDGSVLNASVRANVLTALPYYTGANTEHVVRVGVEVTAVGSIASLGIYDIATPAYPLPSSLHGQANLVVSSNFVCTASINVYMKPDRLHWVVFWTVSSVTMAQVKNQQLPPIFGYDPASGHALGVAVASWGTATLPGPFPASSCTLVDSPVMALGILLGA